MAGAAVNPLPVLEPADVAAAGRALRAPFVLCIAGAPGDDRLVCREILRLLPGRRLVARVEASGRDAVLKLFMGPGAARYRAREARGCERLAAAGVATPALVGAVEGTDRRGATARGLLFEYLGRVQPVSPGDDAAFAAAAAHLGRLHRGGGRHRDLHLNNFLARADGAVYVVDGDAVRRAGWRAQLGVGRSIAELAVLCAQRPPLADAGLEGVYRAYAAARGWPPEDRARLARLAAATVRRRRSRVRRFLKKARRDCTEFHRQRTWRRSVMAVREAWDEALEAFAADPEAVMRSGRVLKDGNSATVVRARLGGRSRVIKRYNLKGPWHALRRALRPMPRYRVAWLNGQRLRMLDIPTARPLALVEHRAGPWRGVAYLVLEDLGDTHLADEVESRGLSDARLGDVVRVFSALAAAGLAHGDTKASNFLVTAGGVALIDLDAMVESTRRERDRRRFLDNFGAMPEVRERFRRAL